ncbi:hypothetical protein, partial [Polaribacter sp.]|uniref:hypothetical protein n=1 Tax=Polaribacter sp. TaxID=1920175 RepID=UPI003F6B7389
ITISTKNGTLNGKGTLQILSQKDLSTTNSFDKPNNTKVSSSEFEINNGTIKIELEGQSLNVFKIKM